MRILVRLTANFIAFLVLGIAVRAVEPPPVNPAAAKAEFEKVRKEFNAVDAELRILQVEYRKAAKAARPALDKQWKQTILKGEEIKAKFFDAVEKAFTANAFAGDPKATKEVATLMKSIFAYQISSDNYETADRLGKLLIAGGNHEGQVFALAGSAAVAVGDFNTAATDFAEAHKAKIFATEPDPNKERHMWNAYHFAKDLGATQQRWEKEQKIREAEAKADDLPRVLIKTDKGDITVELFENEAPNTVANFISLVEKKFYDGLSFHRVIAGFMAQGGDPQGDGKGGPDYTIPDEVSNPDHRAHFRGSLSMAKTNMPNSGGSQFFLCFVPTPYLDGRHTVFGRVISGLEVLAKIERREPDPNAPDPDKIIEMKVLRKREHEYKVKKTGE